MMNADTTDTTHPENNNNNQFEQLYKIPGPFSVKESTYKYTIRENYSSPLRKSGPATS